MSLGQKLIDALKQGATGEVEVSGDSVKGKAQVAGSGPYGSDVQSLSVERVAPLGETRRAGRLAETVDAIQQRVTYLPEQVEAIESDPTSGQAVLRTRRSQVKDREYYEFHVTGGDRVDVGRFRGRDQKGGRDRVDENFGHGVLRRLVDDLGEILGD